MRLCLAFALAILLSPALPGPATAAAPDCAGEAWVESTLYMGRGKADGGSVTDAEVQAFVDDVIVQAFPDGFTLFEARGHWRDDTSGRSVNETTVAFVVTHPPGAEAGTALRRIADAYIARFEQTAVLGSSHPVCITVYQ